MVGDCLGTARRRDEAEGSEPVNANHGAPVRLSYRKIRDVSTDAEVKNGAATYVAVLPALEILKIGTEGNLRDYIPDHPGKKRSLVHKAIGKTIRDYPDRFSQLNSGFLIGGRKIAIDDQKKELAISDASVNNGAQSQGEINLYLQECQERGDDPQEFDIRVEISVEPDPAQRTEIAISRNTTTRIQDISQAGKRGYFNDLANSFSKAHPDLKLSTSETDIGDEYVDTRLLLQILWALLPAELMPAGRTSIEARMRAYKNAAQCLSGFEDTFRNKDNKDEPEAARRYAYFCDMAGEAWSAYLKWQGHSGWEGRRLRADAKQVRGGRNGKIVVADGVLFPIMAALSNFVHLDTEGVWRLSVPPIFRDEHLLEAARRQLLQHQGKPMLMGRSGPAYEGLMLLTEMANNYAAAD